jgi:hypothetical protein
MISQQAVEFACFSLVVAGPSHHYRVKGYSVLCTCPNTRQRGLEVEFNFNLIARFDQEIFSICRIVAESSMSKTLGKTAFPGKLVAELNPTPCVVNGQGRENFRLSPPGSPAFLPFVGVTGKKSLRLEGSDLNAT